MENRRIAQTIIRRLCRTGSEENFRVRTIEELAEITKIPESTLYKINSGIQTPGVETMRKLFNSFKKVKGLGQAYVLFDEWIKTNGNE